MDWNDSAAIRKHLDLRFGSMTQERSSFIKHWQDLSKFVQPRRGRFLLEDRNRGERRDQEIINNEATMALRTARAGLFAGVMSPSRPWFQLELQDKDLMEFQPVKIWLATCQDLLYSIFRSSNLYKQAPVMMGELLLFGTGAMTHVDDFENVARFYTHTIGSYCIAQSDRQEINTFAHEYQMQTSAMVEEFGYDNCSNMVRTAWDRGDRDGWWTVRHYIGPNPMPDARTKLAKDKPFWSIKYEPGSNDGRILKRSGFDEFPAYIPRWDTTGEDVYGTSCPGMDALGDTRALQHQEKRKAQSIDKMTAPPLSGPPSLANKNVAGLPGSLVTYEGAGEQNRLQPIYQITPPLQELRLDMDAISNRIKSAFYVDLWMAISTMEGIQPRNQFELMQRNQERLLQLGPVLEAMHGEFLNKLIDRTWNQCIRAKILPPAPEEIQGQQVKVEYISSLAQAQRAVATGGIERLAAFVRDLATVPGKENVVDKFDSDQAVDEYGSVLGVPPRLVVPDDQVAAVRQQREKAAQEAQQAQLAQMQTAAARDGAQAMDTMSKIEVAE